MFYVNLITGMILLCFSLTTFAQGSSGGGGGGGGGSSFSQRAAKRESSRWTLQEWLAQKDRNRMMDMWLSMNSPSPYELMLGISYNSYKSTVDTPASENSYTSYMGSFAAYAQFVGVGVEYENNTREGYNDLNGLFNLRLLGSSIQGSYLAVHYGMRTRQMTNPDVRLSQQFAQATIQLYVIKQFGFDGLYRQYLKANDATLGDVSGTLAEGGAFIDFQNFRIFGSWYKEVQNQKTTTTETKIDHEGIRSGLKIFF